LRGTESLRCKLQAFLLLLLLGLLEAINAAFTDAGFHLCLGRYKINQTLRNAGTETPARGVIVGAARVVFAAEWAGIFVDGCHGVSDG
jgi:hypothetical protein